MTRVTTNNGNISTLMDDVSALKTSVSDLKAAALIEDYFTINLIDSETFPEQTVVPLFDSFCITEPGIFIFNLAVTFSSLDAGTRVPNVRT